MAFPLSDEEHAAIKARIDGQRELIVAAAMRVGRVVMMAERPGRHADCINTLWRLGAKGGEHGFLTNRGRFVDREEAARIVVAAGQTTPREGYGHLFSEDVWNDWDEEPRGPIRPDDIF